MGTDLSKVTGDEAKSKKRQIIKGKIEPNDAVQLLLSRPLKIE